MIIIPVIFGIICSYIHQKKGFSPVAGFLWGFFFSWIGVLVVALETDKATIDEKYAGKRPPLSVGMWILILVGAGTLVIFTFFFLLSTL